MTVHRFTDRWIQSCCAASDRDDYADALCPGLHLRVSRRTKTFSAMVRVNRRLHRRTLGRYPGLSLAQARDATLELIRKAAEGVDPREPEAEKIVPINFGDLVAAYVNLHLKPNARTWKTIAASLNDERLKPFRTRAAVSITKAEIVALIDHVAETAPQAAVNLLRRLKMLFNWAAARDMVPANPCDRVRPPARTVERDRVLTDTELVAVWRATFRLPDPIGQMFQMFILTGQRRGEVSTMRWSEVLDDLWVIPREKVKKDRPHAVPLTATAARTLASLPRWGEQAYVFTTTGGKSSCSNFTKVRATLETLSGTSGWTIHDIRRTVRSKLAELRVPREIARKVLNHEDGKVDRIYNRHEYLTEKREALEQWEKHLLSLASSFR